MQVLIGHSSAGSSVLSKYQNEILKYHSVSNGDTFRGEYMVRKNTISNLTVDALETLDQKLPINNFYFKPNQTLALEAEHFRQQINGYNKSCDESFSITIDKPITLWKIYFTENAIGKLLAKLAQVALENVRDKKCNIDLMVNATDLLFAVKNYYLQNGSYPARLALLAPQYIAVLPFDPYSGKNFILNSDKKIIYSIGSDHHDDGGGDLSKQWNLMGDPTFSYDFAVTEIEAKNEVQQLNKMIDSDHDGLSDDDERERGTDPNNQDTDGDGFTDGVEVANGYDPLK